MALYKKRYLIGLYEDGDEDSLFALFDTAEELRRFINYSESNIYQTISKEKRVNYKGRRLRLKLVDTLDEEEKGDNNAKRRQIHK